MRARGLALLLSCACGVPEQLLQVQGRVEAQLPDAGALLVLREDEGLTPEGCSAFSRVREVEATPAFSFDVLRAEVVGPRGTPRCFRLDFEGANDSHSLLTWAPLDHDVQLPAFRVWPRREPFAEGVRESEGQVAVRRLTDDFVRGTADTIDLLPLRQYVDVVDDRGQRAWRIEAPPGSPAETSGEFRVVVPRFLLEDRAGTVQSGGYRVGRQFDLDPLGRSVELRFEHRALSNTAAVHVTPTVPASRGALCGTGDFCPFTDGDFTPAAVDAGEVTVQLDRGVFVQQVLVRGLWVDRPFTQLRLSFAADGGSTEVVVPVPEQASLLARDGMLGEPRVDLQVFTGRVAARVTLQVSDDQGFVPISRLAELSLFE